MNKFPHLNFIEKIKGVPRRGRLISTDERSEYNKGHRSEHSTELNSNINSLKENWQENNRNRVDENLPPLNPDIIPVFLQLNPKIISDDFDLKSFNIEIISEEEEGFIIGASLDNLNALTEKIQLFSEEKHGGGKIADFWQIIDGNQWRPEHILSEELFNRWSDIDDAVEFVLDVGIAFDKPIMPVPDRSKQGGVARFDRYSEVLEERDALFDTRVDEFESFISYYGEVESIIDLEDSFACQVRINGAGLKDLVINYPYVFEVVEQDSIEDNSGLELENLLEDFDLLDPDPDSIEIAVVDSGIMEQHKFLKAAIKPKNSKSYIVGETSTADEVVNGGHGTRVAGALIYPFGISGLNQPYKLPFFIRNIRVLNSSNSLVDNYPAALMRTIVKDNLDCRIFNMSINSRSPSRRKHMSSWASSIDQISHEENILFVLSVGNIRNDQIRRHINRGELYPDYLGHNVNRLSNPAQSCFSIAVGSINGFVHDDDYFKSIEGEDDISSFSKIGLGIWDMNKPDVVEYGGGLVKTKNSPYMIRVMEQTSPELLRSTLGGGNAISRDIVGTSFAAPKVAHILAKLLEQYPEEDINLIRAILVQSARLPKDLFYNPTLDSIRHYGNGIPNLERSLSNNPYRITFYNTGEINADESLVYSVKIPEDLKKPEEDHDILIEVTLAFTSDVRRTRQKTKSYLATWLDWSSSKKGESVEEFKDFILKEFNGESISSYEKEKRNSLSSWNWKLKNRKDHGEVNGVSRSNGSLQKDWCISKSYDLPEEFIFAIKGHKSWDRTLGEIPFAVVVSFEAIESSIEVYDLVKIENEVELPVEV